MNPYESLYDKQRREEREKRERADLEYEREEAQRRADRAAADRDEARKRAARDRAVAAEELEYAREAEANAEAEAREVKRRAAELERLLRAIIAAWESVIPDNPPRGGVKCPSVPELVEEAKAFLNPIPPMPE